MRRVRAVLVGGLVALPLLPPATLPASVELGIVYAVVVLATVVTRFFMPSRFMIIADVVPADQQSRASGITQTTGAIAGVVGPPLAAPLLFTAGIEWALALNAMSFAFSYLVIRNLQTPDAGKPRATKGEGTGFWQEFRTGMAAMMPNRVVRSMVVMGVITNGAAQVYVALGVFFVITNLHTRASFYGIQDTMLGIGAIIGAAITSWLGVPLGQGRTIWVGILLFGVLLGAYARTSNFLIALGALLLAAIPLGAVNTAISLLLLRSKFS